MNHHLNAGIERPFVVDAVVLSVCDVGTIEDVRSRACRCVCVPWRVCVQITCKRCPMLILQLRPGDARNGEGAYNTEKKELY